MSDYLLSLFLGIVEGLTEFLPVSSTAHLRIAEALWSIVHPSASHANVLESPYWKMYSVVIQLGAILCLPIYFRERLAKFIKTFPDGERGDRTVFNHPLTLVMIAFVVTAGPSYILEKQIGKHLESLFVMGAALLIGGIVMWVVDAVATRRFNEKEQSRGRAFEMKGVPLARGTPVTGVAAALNPAATVLDDEEAKAANSIGFHHTDHVEDMNIVQAVWIGACQIMSAVFPGTSRSMSTIAAGQIAGMSRRSALEFSFFLSIPTMFIATCWTFLKAVGLRKSSEGDETGPIVMNAHLWIVLAIGFIVSFFVAWAVVAWFMAWVRRRGFAPFAVYRIIVGLIVLVWAVNSPGKPDKPVHDLPDRSRPGLSTYTK